MKCLETRKTREGWTRRRYERDDGTRFTTFELPAEVVGHVGRGKLRDCMQAHARGSAVRSRAQQIKQGVALRVTWKNEAIAHELGVSVSRVQQIKAELKEQKP